MERQYEHNGKTYWVKVEPAVHETTGNVVYMAFVGDSKPTAMAWGYLAKGPDGRAILFATEHAALINAQAIKQSEIDSATN